MSPTPCPPPADLAGFHRGGLPPASADAVAAHVERCPACESVLQALDAAAGSLADAFRRSPADRTDAWAGGPAPLPDGAGTVVGGRYKLVEPVGEGGMGSVWMAQQTEPVRRLVAVKLIKAGMDSRTVLARFEAERQALALMDHPNIAKVLDAGATAQGRPFFVMELVKGVPITDYCDQHKLTPRDRLALFVPVCQAVQHAHQKGVIHRDLKPSNVLVARYDGKPVPKVIDFGVAKAAGQPLTDKTLVTGFGAVVGTPEYMAPEQAELNQLDVDTRADVYALGVLLYELLTGSTPLTRQRLGQAALLEVLRLVREEEPPVPSSRLSTAEALPSIAASRGTEPKRLTALMRGELDWVVMKALEKDRTRRYESAGGFARDVERYLADEPVEAGRPTAGHRLRKFAHRHRRPLTLAAAAVLLLVTAAAVSGWQAVRATRARNDAQTALERVSEEERKARDELATREAVLKFFDETLLSAGRPEGQGGGLGKDVTLRKALDVAVPKIGPAFTGRPRIEAAVRRMIGASYHYLGEYAVAIEQRDHACRLLAAAVGPDHPDALDVTTELASSHSKAGHYLEALRLYEQVRAVRADRLGPGHPATLDCLFGIAGSHQDEGRWPEALRLFEEVVAGRVAALGPDHEHVHMARSSLGIAYWLADRPAEALPHFERAAAGMRAVHGPDHPETLICLNNLASGYNKVGRKDDAIRLLWEVLALKDGKIGRDHLSYLTTLNNIGYMYNRVGRSAEAVQLLEEAAARMEKNYKGDHLVTLVAVNSLAEAYHLSGRVSEALPRYHALLAARRKKFPADHPDTARTVFELAGVYLTAGRPADARPLYAEFLAGQRTRHAAAPAKLAADLASVGEAYLRAGLAADAEPLLRESLTLRVASEPDAGTTFRTHVLLGAARAERGEPAEAEQLLKTGYDGLLARMDKLATADRAGLPQAADALARLYTAQSKSDDAARWRAERAKYPPETAPPPRPAP